MTTTGGTLSLENAAGFIGDGSARTGCGVVSMRENFPVERGGSDTASRAKDWDILVPPIQNLFDFLFVLILHVLEKVDDEIVQAEVGDPKVLCC